MTEDKKNNFNPWKSASVFAAWIKKRHVVQVWFSTGAKFEGIIKHIDQYEITVEDPETKQVYIFFKGQIACITKVKGVQKK